jgi:hypothetical protein
MRNWILGSVAAIIGSIWFLGIAFLASSHASPHPQDDAYSTPPRPRFEKVLDEKHDKDYWTTRFYVWHDRETGQEIVCVYNSYGDGVGGCYLTGRKW